MAAPRLDRRILSKAPKPGLVRLAKFVGVCVRDDCTCNRCNSQLVEVLVRKLDREEPWPPRISERRWS